MTPHPSSEDQFVEQPAIGLLAQRVLLCRGPCMKR